MPRSRAAPLRATGDAAYSACSRRLRRARGELLGRTGSHGSRVAPHATLGWRGAMCHGMARTNRRERASTAHLPPAPLAKLFRSMSRACLTGCSVQQPWRYVPWRLVTADTTLASLAGSSSGAALQPVAEHEQHAPLATQIGRRSSLWPRRTRVAPSCALGSPSRSATTGSARCVASPTSLPTLHDSVLAMGRIGPRAHATASCRASSGCWYRLVLIRCGHRIVRQALQLLAVVICTPRDVAIMGMSSAECCCRCQLTRGRVETSPGECPRQSLSPVAIVTPICPDLSTVQVWEQLAVPPSLLGWIEERG